MQGTRVGRDGSRRRGVVITGATVLGLVLTLSGCGPLPSEQTSAAPSSTAEEVQAPSETATDTVAPPTGPIPTVTADPLSPDTPTTSSTLAATPTGGPTTTSAPTVAPTDTPVTGTPVTAPPTPTQTAVPGTAGACARTLAAYPVLEPGAEGAAVRALQCFLNDDRYGPVTVDGVYGTETRAAVRRVEAGFEGPPPHPGRIDAGMWVLVISRSLRATTLQLGSTGPDVVTLQRALRAAGATLAVDGRFGAQTKKAVQRLQDANRVGPDGIVKDETLFLLKNGATIG